MEISSKNNISFEGRFIPVGKISPQQKYIFNQYRPILETYISDKPYDLFIKQSKSKHSIMISTDKNFKTWESVKKKEKNYKQNYIEVVQNVIKQKELELARELKLKQDIAYSYFQEKLLGYKNFI